MRPLIIATHWAACPPGRRDFPSWRALAAPATSFKRPICSGMASSSVVDKNPFSR
jgi:hypothetical protein